MLNENVLDVNKEVVNDGENNQDKIQVRDKILRTPPNNKSVSSSKGISGKLSPPKNDDKNKNSSMSNPNAQSGKTSSASQEKQIKTNNQNVSTKKDKNVSANTKDKNSKSNEKQTKTPSSLNSKSSKSGNTKNQQHQSRPIEKLKSATDRRTSSSNKRRRQESTDEDETPNSEESLIESDKSKMEEEEEKSDEEICRLCNSGFSADDSCIYCGCCRSWFHASCQDITEEEITAFRILKKLAHYFCPQCSVGASEIYKAQVRCKERIDNLEKRVEDIIEDKDEIKADVTSIKSQQSKNKSSIKTLETIHKTLRKDVDENSSSIKNLTRKEKIHARGKRKN